MVMIKIDNLYTQRIREKKQREISLQNILSSYGMTYSQIDDLEDSWYFVRRKGLIDWLSYIFTANYPIFISFDSKSITLYSIKYRELAIALGNNLGGEWVINNCSKEGVDL